MIFIRCSLQLYKIYTLFYHAFKSEFYNAFKSDMYCGLFCSVIQNFLISTFHNFHKDECTSKSDIKEIYLYGTDQYIYSMKKLKQIIIKNSLLINNLSEIEERYR